MSSPLVSVIMSVFNDENYLTQSLDSILNQTFQNFEFIIINDNSSDNSGKILKKYANNINITLLENTKNIGLTKSLNKALDIAKGKYIARQDADDISYLNRLEKQVEFLEKHSNIFLLGTSIQYMSNSGEEKEYFIKKFDKKKLPQKNTIFHSSIMFRNKGIRYRDKFYYAQDYDLYLRCLSENLEIGVLLDVLLRYRKNTESISIKNNYKQELFANKAREFYNERLETGNDSYENFDMNSILNMNIDRKIQQEKNILIQLSLENYSQVNHLLFEYIRDYKINIFVLKIFIVTKIPFLYRFIKKLK